MGRPRKNIYLTSDQIYEGWKDWKRTGVVPEYWAKQMLLIANEMLKMPQFSGYPREMKSEMAQEAALKILKNIHNMREEKHTQFFNYWSCCCYSAFITYLRKHYKLVNDKREFLLTALEYAKDNNISNVRPDILKNIQSQIELYNTPEQGVEE